ncbi:hypothetical protein BH23ACT5_BH23ACT5_05480 [soil metagenome]
MTAAVAAAVGVIAGGLIGGVIALAAVVAWSRIPRRRPQPVDVVATASRLLVLVGSGVSLGSALAASTDPSTASELELVARRARRVGTSAALASSSGPLSPLLRRLADASVSGAPLEPTIRSFIESERRRRHAAAIERARRMPVRLMVPMALLVLPGFVLMVYGPALIGLVVDLLGPMAT